MAQSSHGQISQYFPFAYIYILYTYIPAKEIRDDFCVQVDDFPSIRMGYVNFQEGRRLCVCLADVFVDVVVVIQRNGLNVGFQVIWSPRRLAMDGLAIDSSTQCRTRSRGFRYPCFFDVTIKCRKLMYLKWHR